MFGLNRYLCDVLSDMRKCYETRNFSYLLGLIEEAQSMANRMEAALEDNRDVKELKERRSELRKQVKELQKKVDKLNKDAE